MMKRWALVLFLMVGATMAEAARAGGSDAAGAPLRISSVSLTRAGDGTCVAGAVEPAPGSGIPRAAVVEVCLYGAAGRLIAEGRTAINRNDLGRTHLRPHPRAPYAVFFPVRTERVEKVVVSLAREDSGRGGELRK